MSEKVIDYWDLTIWCPKTRSYRFFTCCYYCDKQYKGEKCRWMEPEQRKIREFLEKLYGVKNP